MRRAFAAIAGLWLCAAAAFLVHAGVAFAEWQPLFNGRDLTGWDSYLAPPPGSETPLGLNHDPRGVFRVVEIDGAPAIRISGEIYGAITTQEEYGNFHLRLEYKWGEKRWPPRETVGRDSGILYCCVGPHGAGSQAWMRSVECNIMEKGVGQWWSVDGAIVDVEAVAVTKALEPEVPYKKESPGESILLYRRGAPRRTATPGDGITPSVDDERPRGEWNTVEVIFWAGQCIHLLNGRVNMVLSNPRHEQDGKVTPLRAGRIQLQSEAAECYYRNIEIRPIGGIPERHLELLPAAQDGDDGFAPLFGDDAGDGWAQCGPGGFELAQGVATAKGGMGLWWHTRHEFKNFILRGEFLQEQPLADSGVFFRFPDPGKDPWAAVKKGHEMEIGDPNPEKPTWRTGSIYPFQASVSAEAKRPGEWNSFEIVAIGHDYSVRLNGRLVTTWSDPERRSLSGHIGLQNYDDGKTVRFRRLRIRELP